MAADDEYWKRIGEENPYWAVLTHDRFLGTELAPAAKKEFMQSGADDIAFVLSLIMSHIRADFAPKMAMDFGCGVGRLTLAMAPFAEDIVGVDISPGMLARTAANAADAGIANLRLMDDIPDEQFDWINSYIVLQHIEPQRGTAILDALLSHLAPGGVASLHVTIFRDERTMHGLLKETRTGRFDGREYVSFDRRPHGEMSIYEYDLSEVVSRFVRHGLHTLTMRHLDHEGLHGVWIVAAKE